MTDSIELVSFLKTKTVSSGFVDQLKVNYRPLICPFDDLLNLLGNQPVKVMDIGCGSGQFMLLLAEFSQATKIAGIEISQKLIDNARKLLARYPENRISVNLYNGNTFPVSMNEYDYLFLVDVLHHVPDAQKLDFLSGIFNGMKKNSHLVVKDINAASPWVIFNKIHDLVFSGEIGQEWSIDKLCAVAQKIGFRIVDIKKRRMYVYPHYTVVFAK